MNICGCVCVCLCIHFIRIVILQIAVIIRWSDIFYSNFLSIHGNCSKTFLNAKNLWISTMLYRTLFCICWYWTPYNGLNCARHLERERERERKRELVSRSQTWCILFDRISDTVSVSECITSFGSNAIEYGLGIMICSIKWIFANANNTITHTNI